MTMTRIVYFQLCETAEQSPYPAESDYVSSLLMAESQPVTIQPIGVAIGQRDQLGLDGNIASWLLRALKDSHSFGACLKSQALRIPKLSEVFYNQPVIIPTDELVKDKDGDDCLPVLIQGRVTLRKISIMSITAETLFMVLAFF